MKAVWISGFYGVLLVFSLSAQADVAVRDDTVKGAVDEVKSAVEDVTSEIKTQLETAETSVRNNQATQIKQFKENRGMATLAGGADEGTTTNQDKRNYLNTQTITGTGSSVDLTKLPDNYIPASDSCLDDVDTGNCVGYKGEYATRGSAKLRKSMKVDYSVLDVFGSDEYQKMMDKMAEQNAQQLAVHQVMAEEAYLQATNRFKTIQTLMNKLNDKESTDEPKEVMDLQARIQAEQMMLQNEQVKLAALAQMQQLRKDIYEQKTKEANNYRRKPDAKHAQDGAAHQALVDARRTAAAVAIAAANTALLDIVKSPATREKKGF